MTDIMMATGRKAARTPLLRFFTVLFTLCAILLPGACSAGQSGGSAPGKEESSSATSLAKGPITVVASVNQWGSLASELGGNQVSVTSLLKNTSVDAHEFSPTTSDIAKLTNAQVVIVNGAGYDSWATKTSTHALATINAASTIGAEEGDNPHLWFSADVRGKMAQSIRDTYCRILPSHKKYFASLYSSWEKKQKKLSAQIADFASKHKDKSYGATESVAYYLMADLGMKDATPATYTRAMQNSGEPSAADLHAFQKIIENHDISVLINNPQETSDMSNMLTSTAGKSSVPVVDVTEQIPARYTSLDQWISNLVSAFSKALDQADKGSES